MRFFEETCRASVEAIFTNIDMVKENILKAKDNPELLEKLLNTLDFLNYKLENIYIENGN